jgi:hypothetical protein
MIQTQSQNEEIKQIDNMVWDEVRRKVWDKVWNEVWNEVWWKVGNEVGNEVFWKVEVGFTAKNNVRKWLFFS